MSLHFTSPLSGYIKLIKGELQPSRKRFNWVISENKYFKLSQVRRLREYCEETRKIGIKDNKPHLVRNWFMIELGLFCGLRVSEMINLKVNDLNIGKGNSSLIVRNGKGGKTRVVVFGEDFKQTCLDYLQCITPTNKDSYLFTNKTGKKLTKRSLQKAFKRCLEASGLNTDYGIHCLRHTYATHLYKSSNHNLRLVQKQLGHSSIKTTQVYADVVSEDARRAVKKIYGKRGDEDYGKNDSFN